MLTEVWLHKADFNLCINSSTPAKRQQAINRMHDFEVTPPEMFNPEAYLNKPPGNLKKLDIGRIFNLGGLTVSVINMEGHTPGSIGLFIKEKKVLLDSDSANSGTWLFLEESLPLSRFVSMVKRVKELDFDEYFSAHSGGPFPKSHFDMFIKAAYNATVEKSEPLTYIPNVTGYVYKEDGIGLTFCVNKKD
jgi:glyoxylase-like metal-dependent hydrolase (beta-lactamase superfamily II)